MMTPDERVAWKADLEAMQKWRDDIIAKVGGGSYPGWIGSPGADVCVDGDFTSEQLRMIADALDEWNAR